MLNTSDWRFCPSKKPTHARKFIPCISQASLLQTACHRPQSHDYSHKDRFAVKRAAHGGHGHGSGCKLHGPGCQILCFGVFHKLGLLSSWNPCDPLQKGSHAKRFRISFCSQFGVCLKNRTGSVSRKFRVTRPQQKLRTPFSPRFRSVSRFLYGHPLKPRRECVPTGAGAGGCRCSLGLLSSGQPNFAVHSLRILSHVVGRNLLLNWGSKLGG